MAYETEMGKRLEKTLADLEKAAEKSISRRTIASARSIASFINSESVRAFSFSRTASSRQGPPHLQKFDFLKPLIRHIKQNL